MSSFNEHPKKPHPSKADELLVPYHLQKEDTRIKLKDNTYRPEDDGKPDFIGKVKGVTTFSDKEYFNTVFISGDDMDAEIKALKQKEIDDFNAKVVVDSKTFKVNTKVLESE